MKIQFNFFFCSTPYVLSTGISTVESGYTCEYSSLSWSTVLVPNHIEKFKMVLGYFPAVV